MPLGMWSTFGASPPNCTFSPGLSSAHSLAQSQRVVRRRPAQLHRLQTAISPDPRVENGAEKMTDISSQGLSGKPRQVRPSVDLLHPAGLIQRKHGAAGANGQDGTEHQMQPCCTMPFPIHQGKHCNLFLCPSRGSEVQASCSGWPGCSAKGNSLRGSHAGTSLSESAIGQAWLCPMYLSTGSGRRAVSASSVFRRGRVWKFKHLSYNMLAKS